MHSLSHPILCSLSKPDKKHDNKYNISFQLTNYLVHDNILGEKHGTEIRWKFN